MRSIKTIIFFTSLITIITAVPSNTITEDRRAIYVITNSNPNLTDFKNTSESQKDERYKVLRSGKRVPNDELLGSGQKLLRVKKNNNTIRFKVSSDYTISFILFNYTSMNENLSNCSLKVIRGGPGYRTVTIKYSSNSTAIFVQYEIYGLIKENISRMQAVKSIEDLYSKYEEAGTKLVVVFFYNELTKVIQSKMNEISLDYLDVVFLKVHERLKDIFHVYSIDELPTIVFIKNSLPDGFLIGDEVTENNVRETIEFDE